MLKHEYDGGTFEATYSVDILREDRKTSADRMGRIALTCI